MVFMDVPSPPARALLVSNLRYAVFLLVTSHFVRDKPWCGRLKDAFLHAISAVKRWTPRATSRPFLVNVYPSGNSENLRSNSRVWTSLEALQIGGLCLSVIYIYIYKYPIGFPNYIPIHISISQCFFFAVCIHMYFWQWQKERNLRPYTYANIYNII